MSVCVCVYSLLHSFFAQTTSLRRVIEVPSRRPMFQYLSARRKGKHSDSQTRVYIRDRITKFWDCAHIFLYHTPTTLLREHIAAIKVLRFRLDVPPAIAACFSDLLPSSVFDSRSPVSKPSIDRNNLKKKKNKSHNNSSSNCFVCTGGLLFVFLWKIGKLLCGHTAHARASSWYSAHGVISTCVEKEREREEGRRRQTEEKSLETLVMSLSTQKHPAHSFYSGNQIYPTEVWGTSAQPMVRPLTRIFLSIFSTANKKRRRRRKGSYRLDFFFFFVLLMSTR